MANFIVIYGVTMPRARNIKPSFFKNELLVDLPVEARLLFIGLWTLADREGRLEYRPKRIKFEIYPNDNFDVEKLLYQLSDAKFIKIYQINGKSYIQIETFKEHQKPHHGEKASAIPEPPLNPEINATSCVDFALNAERGMLNAECGKLKEEKPPRTKKKVSLEELSVNHVKDWLAEKRIQGKYIFHDENHVLDQYKNYCLSKGKIYADYVAGYRNAFEWDRCKPSQDKHLRSQEAATRGHARAAVPDF